jgi:hypothetical protein
MATHSLIAPVSSNKAIAHPRSVRKGSRRFSMTVNFRAAADLDIRPSEPNQFTFSPRRTFPDSASKNLSPATASA